MPNIVRHLAWLLAMCGSAAAAGDLRVAPLFDGERTELDREGLLNHWGGPFGVGNIEGVARQSQIVHTGRGALRADLGSISAGTFGFFQTYAGPPAADIDRRQTRDLTRYARLKAYVRNDSGQPLTLKLELKDYRDSLSHRASRSFVLPADARWTEIATSLDLSSGWSVAGTPELDRTYVMSFVMTPIGGPAAGAVFVDDLQLIEPGAPLLIDTAPTDQLVAQLARRQFEALWAARHRETGLVPNTSHESQWGALNVTAGLMWMLPSAVRQGWLSQPAADEFTLRLTSTLHRVLDQTQYLPPRFLDFATADPVGRREESSIDASFMALAIHRYKSQPQVAPSLASALDAVQNRFDFSAFATEAGFKLAHFADSGFTAGTYDGYTHEGKLISLAAELSDDHRVPLDQLWNADRLRVRTHLARPEFAHLVHSMDSFRAPFVQALFSLFAATSDRGRDNYPVAELATNPWQNFVHYEKDVAARLQQLGRPHLFQPDAGQGGPPAHYQQYSLYQDFGQSDLLMPWSVAFALLAEADGADAALRWLLQSGLHGPLGMADSARWATGADAPAAVPAFQDHWNTVLATMAFLEYLEGPQSASRSFSQLPRVNAALDRVFFPRGDFNRDSRLDLSDVDMLVANIAADAADLLFDLNGDSLLDRADLSAWLQLAGAANLPAGQSYLAGDADLDGAVDVSDFNRWNAHKFQNAARWSQGDFNADGVVDASDFNLWNEHKFSSAWARAVGEPWPAGGLLWWGLLLLALRTSVPAHGSGAPAPECDQAEQHPEN